MQATAKVRDEVRKVVEPYLGFGIQVLDGWFVATPMGWTGEVLLADDMPALRRKIWRWWHQVL